MSVLDLSKVEWVRQETTTGCVVACFAMVTGQTYAAAMQQLAHLYRNGVSIYSVVNVLEDMGWWQQGKYRDYPHYSGDTSRASWEREVWPPEPWADLHLCTVVVAGGSGAAHGVVMLRDGSVLDPLSPEHRRLSDYAKVDQVVGLLRPYSGEMQP